MWCKYGNARAAKAAMAEVNWRRVFAISSFVMAIMLISGSIYLHLQKKHHLGRMHHRQHIVAVAETTTAATEGGDNLAVSDECLKCLCQTVGGCYATEQCHWLGRCGFYKFTFPYFLDTDNPAAANKTHAAYFACANNKECAASVVRSYFRRYWRDCNKDGVVDCRDHVALHIYGPTGCNLSKMEDLFADRLENCLAPAALTVPAGLG